MFEQVNQVVLDSFQQGLGALWNAFHFDASEYAYSMQHGKAEASACFP